MIECIVVCEAGEDGLIATGLADRVITEKNAWADGQLDTLRAWRGIEPETETRDDLRGVAFTRWTQVKEIARREGIKVHGKYGRGHGRGARVEARKVLILANRLDAAGARPLLLVRDTDGSSQRAEGVRDAVQEAAGERAVVVALPHPEMEAWVLNGFEPCDDDEHERLRSQRQALGFDPCCEAHRLNPGAETSAGGEPIKKSTKRVLEALTGDHERKRRCWQDTTLDVLRERGQRTGLADFLDAVAEHLVPLVGA